MDLIDLKNNLPLFMWEQTENFHDQDLYGFAWKLYETWCTLHSPHFMDHIKQITMAAPASCLFVCTNGRVNIAHNIPYCLFARHFEWKNERQVLLLWDYYPQPKLAIISIMQPFLYLHNWLYIIMHLKNKSLWDSTCIAKNKVVRMKAKSTLVMLLHKFN